MIPVHEPIFYRDDIDNLLEAIGDGQISGSTGRFIEAFERKFAEYCGARHGVAVSSGSTALHLACVIAGIGRGDEVIMNACTNIACANAVVQQGGIVVPIDSDPQTWCMDTDRLQRQITTRTKAIMPVHIYGHPVDMTPVMELAEKFGLTVIEDCAEAHGAEYRGRRVGSIGHMGCFSFYANKIVTCGEGGMIVTNDDEFAKRARSLRNLAFGEPRFMHDEVGFNYRMTNMQAAVGLAQLERIEHTLMKKRQLARWYNERLFDVPGIRRPVNRAYVRNVYWMYGIVIEQEFDVTRDDFMSHLRAHGVDTRTMFCPMNLQPALLKRGMVRTDPCPVAEELWERGLYLPSGCGLTEREVDGICHVIQEMSPTCA